MLILMFQENKNLFQEYQISVLDRGHVLLPQQWCLLLLSPMRGWQIMQLLYLFNIDISSVQTLLVYMQALCYGVLQIVMQTLF